MQGVVTHEVYKNIAIPWTTVGLLLSFFSSLLRVQYLIFKAIHTQMPSHKRLHVQSFKSDNADDNNVNIIMHLIEEKCVPFVFR